MALEALTLDSLQLNDNTVFRMESVDFTPPPELEEWIKGADSDGAILAREPHCDNRVIEARIRVVQQATMDLALAKIGLIVDKLKECQRNANGLALVWTPADSTKTMTFRCLSGQVTGLPVDEADSGWFYRHPVVTVRLTCLPFGEGAPVGWVNRVINPSFETNTTGWTDSGNGQTAPTRVTTQFKYGTASLSVAKAGAGPYTDPYTVFSLPSGVVNALRGRTISASVWVRPDVITKNASSPDRTMLVFDGTTLVQVPLTTGLTAATWQRVTGSLTVAAHATSIEMRLYNAQSSGVAYYDGAMIVEGSVAPTYFDGATGAGYAWLGTAHASESAGPYAVTSSAPIATLEITGVPGDVPALGSLIVADAAAQTRRYVTWGLESRYYPTSSPPSLIVDSSSGMMTAAGYAGATTTTAGAYSNNAIIATLRPQVQAICGIGNLTHVGTFRPQLRFHASATTMAVRLTYQIGDGPLRSLSYKVPAVPAGWNHVDLGQVTIPESTLGAQRWTGRVEALSTAAGGETFIVDAMWLMPAERYGRARATGVQAAGAMIGYDQFTGTTAGGALNGRVAPAGGTWATSGATTDFAFADAPGSGVETVSRSTLTDTGSRHAVLGGTNYTETEVSARIQNTSAFFGSGGIQARWVDVNNRLQFEVGGGFATLIAFVGGATPLFLTAPHTFAANAWYTLHLRVYASGTGLAQMLDAGGAVIVSIPFSHASLATGGALASGRPGLVDRNGSGSAATRYYEDFYAAVPTPEQVVVPSGQSIEFRHDTVRRKDSTGVYSGVPPEYVGGRVTVPNAGGPARKTRVAVIARRNDIEHAADNDVVSNATMDSTTLAVTLTPRYVAIPRA